MKRGLRLFAFVSQRKHLTLFFLFCILLSLPFFIIILSQSQDNRNRAAANSQISFVNSSNQEITEITTPEVRVRLNSPWPVSTTAMMPLGSDVLGQASGIFQVNSSLDDLNEVGGKIDTGYPASSKSIWIGNGGTRDTSYTGLRYTNITIPQNARILSAQLQLRPTQESWIALAMSIMGENKGNSNAFSETSLPSSRALTTQKVSHQSNAKWKTGRWYILSDISPIVQEIVKRNDWQSGNSMSLILKGAGGDFGRKFVYSFDGNALYAPRLSVVYETTNSLTPTPTRIVTSAPFITPTNTPTPTLQPTNTPIPISYIQSITLAEDSTFTKNVKTIDPVIENPLITPYTFSSSTAGQKTLYAKFTSTTGEARVYSHVITLVVNTPTPTHAHSMGENSMAMGRWNPNPKYDTCPKTEDTVRIKEIHDVYKVMGPDGKWYPTWHPPVDPATGCRFGHEHGRDPNGSTMFLFVQQTYGYDANSDGMISGDELATAGVPFGYVNEQLDVWNASKGITDGMRHEDHVGHKIEWENNVERDWSTVNGGSGRVPSGISCDFFMKMHQGTHSKDAFTNNLHELIQGYQCTDGIKMANAIMIRFGKPGEFSVGGVAGGFTPVPVGPATPPNSPSGSGLRSISTIDRVKEFILKPEGQWSLYSEGVYEDWISGNYVRTPNGTQLAYFDPHFAVFGPSRFYWSGKDPNTYGITRTAQDIIDNVGRSTDVCFMQENNGAEKARGGECDSLTNYGQIKTQIPYDDPRSPFNGLKREFYFNNLTVENTGNITLWYSDPFGNNAQTTPFAGGVKQYLKPKNDPQPYPYPFESNALGSDRYYGGDGVHAPN